MPKVKSVKLTFVIQFKDEDLLGMEDLADSIQEVIEEEISSFESRTGKKSFLKFTKKVSHQ